MDIAEFSSDSSDWTFDIERYISQYEGNTKLLRLQFISKKSHKFREVAFNLLITELKKSWNTGFYKSMFEEDEISRAGNECDFSWLEETDRRASQRQVRIETELAAAKNKVIKESIRIGYTDLGDFFSSRGNMQEALKAYIRTRDYCATPRQIADSSINILRTVIDLDQYKNIDHHISKAELLDTGDSIISSKLKIATGLMFLHQSQYQSAALNFLEVDGELGGSFCDVIAAEDVPLYATICSLASIIDNNIICFFSSEFRNLSLSNQLIMELEK